MNYFRFSAFFRGASLALLLAGICPSLPAFAVDDLPPPQEGGMDELPSAPDPQAPIAEQGDLPPPSLGDDLPGAIGGPTESNSNQVNKSDAVDNIYLPSPAGNDINYAPAANAASTMDYGSSSSEWRNGMNNRPVFTLSAGAATRNYATVLVPDPATGYALNASVRLFDVGQTVFIHGLAGASFIGVGDVAPTTVGPSYANLQDKTYHLGGMLEIGIGRRLSLFGTLMRRWNNLSYDPPEGTDSYKQAILGQRNPEQLQFIGEKPAIQLGLGAQYDFYVVPHGSLGVQGRIEKDYFYVGLAMSIEPAPSKKMNLNFEELR